MKCKIRKVDSTIPPKKRCPQCGEDMKKWHVLGGKAIWQCRHCGYKEEER